MTKKELQKAFKLTKKFLGNAEAYGIPNITTDGFGVTIEVLPDESYILEAHIEGDLKNNVYDMLDCYELDEDGNLVELYN